MNRLPFADKQANSKRHVDSLIIGAGASGLFCAAQLGQAYKNNGCHNKTILVIDHAKKPGRKILVSGGGKCNFTNYFVEPDNYICSNPHFCKSALSRYSNWDFIAMVEKHSIAYEERKHGQLFCLSNSKDILTMLLAECSEANVDIQCQVTVSDIKALTVSTDSKPTDSNDSDNRNFAVMTSSGLITCENLIVATGGLSMPALGSTGFGYEVAGQFGHELIPRQAGLVPFTFTDATGDMIKSLSGNAIDVSAIADNEDAVSFQEAMLFTHRGLSGPAMLQISNYWQLGDDICIDLHPQTYFSEILLTAKDARPKSVLRTVLQDYFPKKLLLALQDNYWNVIKDKPVADISNQDLLNVAKLLNNWHIKPSGTEGYRTAEVTLGGISVDEVSSKTMQSKLQPHLYFIGEVLDVTGWLGGYNFQWAWASAYACASSISISN